MKVFVYGYVWSFLLERAHPLKSLRTSDVWNFATWRSSSSRAISMSGRGRIRFPNVELVGNKKAGTETSRFQREGKNKGGYRLKVYYVSRLERLYWRGTVSTTSLDTSGVLITESCT